MANRRQRLLAGASLAIAAALCAAVADPAMAQGRPWKHAVTDPKSDAGFQYMAVRGAFAYKQGIDIQFPRLQSDAIMLRALLAGELDSYDGGPATAIVAGSDNGDVKIVGCHWQTVVDGVLARDDLKSPQDMKGRVMAISASHAAPGTIGKAWLRQHNVALDQVTFSSLGSDPDRYKALSGAPTYPVRFSERLQALRAAQMASANGGGAAPSTRDSVLADVAAAPDQTVSEN